MLHKGLWFEEMINNRNKSAVRDMKVCQLADPPSLQQQAVPSQPLPKSTLPCLEECLYHLSRPYLKKLYETWTFSDELGRLCFPPVDERRTEDLHHLRGRCCHRWISGRQPALGEGARFRLAKCGVVARRTTVSSVKRRLPFVAPRSRS